MAHDTPHPQHLFNTLRWRRHNSLPNNITGVDHVFLLDTPLIVSDLPETAHISAHPRVVLIPRPPPLPTPQMLAAASRAIHLQRIAKSILSSDAVTVDPVAVDTPQPSFLSTVISAYRIIDSDEELDDDLPECLVCMKKQKIDKFPVGQVTERCRHPPKTCLCCLEHSIASDHMNRMWDDIRCPHCCTKLSYADVERYADAATFAHYDLLTTRLALSKLPNYVWCTSCPSGQIHIPGSPSPTDCPAVTCTSCSAMTCFNHRIPWHTGFSCSQYDRLLNPSPLHSLTSMLASIFTPLCLETKKTRESVLPVDVEARLSMVRIEDVGRKVARHRWERKASEKDINRVCKRCPGTGCGVMIFKVDGCKHITCLNCKQEFCWRCKRMWVYGHKCWKFWNRDPY